MDMRTKSAHAVRYRSSMVACPSTIPTEQRMRCRLKTFSPKGQENQPSSWLTISATVYGHSVDFERCLNFKIGVLWLLPNRLTNPLPIKVHIKRTTLTP